MNKKKIVLLSLLLLMFLCNLTACTQKSKDSDSKPCEERIKAIVKYSGPKTLKKDSDFDINEYLDVYEMQSDKKVKFKHVEDYKWPQKLCYSIEVDCGDGKQSCEFSTEVPNFYTFSVIAGSSEGAYTIKEIDITVQDKN